MMNVISAMLDILPCAMCVAYLCAVVDGAAEIWKRQKDGGR